MRGAVVMEAGRVRLRLRGTPEVKGAVKFLEEVAVKTTRGWQSVLTGIPGAEFSTSLGGANADTCSVVGSAATGWELHLSGRSEGWTASEVVTLAPPGQVFRRVQTYVFTQQADRVALHPGFEVRPDFIYTFPLRFHERPVAAAPHMRASVDWALPFPCHVLHTHEWVAVYGVERTIGRGTLDFQPPQGGRMPRVGVYYPDSGPQRTEFLRTPSEPTYQSVEAGDVLTIAEFFAAAPLSEDAVALLEAERLAADVLLAVPPAAVEADRVADGIAGFYRHCDLWNPDALGPGRGWFSNMWVHTRTENPRKRGEMSGYYDLGWGEGIAVEAMLGITRNWRRTGSADLLPYVDEVSRNIECFRAGPDPDAPYFDRSDGTRYGDFLMDVVPGFRIWTHSLGHLGSQLLLLYQENPHYPLPKTRTAWLAAATSIARFLSRHQRDDGDLPDILDEHAQEANPKPHRITARLVVCGLWARLAQVTADPSYLDRARRLCQAGVEEVHRFEYYNQMLDGLAAPDLEFTDGEAAYYVLEGLVPLYQESKDPLLLRLCREAAAFGIAWTYFYDVPRAYKGVARGGQVCRMPDLPLLYPIGPAKAMTPLLLLHQLTGDTLLFRIANEMSSFLARYQLDAPGKPWDGGMVHAIAQYDGRYWGPDLEGQVDCGMATGNSLAALEAWMAYTVSRSGPVREGGV